MSERIPSQTCPCCDKPISAVTNVRDGSRAKPGDITICAYCQGVCILTEAMTQREATDADLRELDRETLETILKARCGLQVFRHTRN